MKRNYTEAPKELPSNCEMVNGHLVCKNEDGRFDLFTEGEGWWGFNLDRDTALRTANAVRAQGTNTPKAAQPSPMS